MPLYITVAFAEETDYDLGIFAGPDPALFTEIDEPRILEGRRPDPSDPHEVLINRFTQENLGVDVGDTVSISTFSARAVRHRGRRLRSPVGPRDPDGDRGHRGDRVRPRRPGVQRLLRHAGLPRGVLGRGGRVRAHPRDRAPTLVTTSTPSSTAPSRTSGWRRCSSASARTRPRRWRTARGCWPSGWRPSRLVAGLAALVAGAQALHRRMAETADDVPALRALGIEPRRVHDRRGPLVAPGHRGRCRAGRRARDRGLGLDADRPGEEGRAQPRGRRRPARARDRRAAARAPARCERGLRSTAGHPHRPAPGRRRRLERPPRPCSPAAASRRRASSGSPWPSTRARVGPRSPSGRRSSARRSAWRGSWRP